MTEPYPPGSRFVAYLRASPGNAQVGSITRQRADIERWCDERAYSVVTWFEDDNRRGGSVVGREAFWRLMAYLEQQPDIAGVLVAEPSRWSRDYDESQYYTASVRMAGYAFVAIDNPTPDTPIGRVIESIHAAYAEEETQRLSARVRSGIHQWRTRAKTAHGAYPPLGYAFEPVITGQNRDGTPRTGRRLVPDPQDAPKVRRAFELAAQGYSLSEILAQAEIGTDVTSISRMLGNPVYIGIGRARGGNIPDMCEPLIPDALYWRVQELRKTRREKYGPRQVRSRHLLSALVYCGYCGWPMSVVSPRSVSYFRCTHTAYYHRDGTCDTRTISAEHLERAVLARLRELLDDPETIREVYAEIERRRSGHADRQTRLDAQAREVTDMERRGAAIVRQLEQLDQAGASSELLLARLIELEKDTAAARDKLAAMRAEPVEAGAPVDFDAMRGQFIAALDNAPRRKLQLLLRAMNAKVTVTKPDGARSSEDYEAVLEFEIAGAEIRVEL